MGDSTMSGVLRCNRHSLIISQAAGEESTDLKPDILTINVGTFH